MPERGEVAVPEASSSRPLTLCIVFAHPDDESFGVAGTVALYAGRGVRTALICTTRGEAGMTNGLAGTPAELATLRSDELACAASAMGLHDLVLFDFVDGQGESWDRTALAGAIAGELRRLEADAVVTFDCNGITYHPDHIVVSQVTQQVVAGGDAGPRARRLYYQVITCPEEASPEGPGLACVPPEAVDITVDVRDFEDAKRAALRCHRSQAADTALMLDRPPGTLIVEQYQLAWAADGWRPAPGETDLLAGL
jgi:N-acetylglucosamine malate deacetylase 2